MDSMEELSPSPPLPPELWNFAVVAVICGLVGWLMRLSQLCLTLADVRLAVRSEAVRSFMLHVSRFGSQVLTSPPT